MLLFLALKQLTRTSNFELSTSNVWASAFVAALFAVHPLRVESVAWVSERKDVLSGVFFMLTLLAYASYARSQRRRTGSYLLVTLFRARPYVQTTFVVCRLFCCFWTTGRSHDGKHLPAISDQRSVVRSQKSENKGRWSAVL